MASILLMMSWVKVEEEKREEKGREGNGSEGKERVRMGMEGRNSARITQEVIVASYMKKGVQRKITFYELICNL